VFSESTGLSFLKQSSGPTPSDSLEERLGKTKSSDVVSSIPEYSSEGKKLAQVIRSAGLPKHQFLPSRYSI
jgi:hypothetical protein